MKSLDDLPKGRNVQSSPHYIVKPIVPQNTSQPDCGMTPVGKAPNSKIDETRNLKPATFLSPLFREPQLPTDRTK